MRRIEVILLARPDRACWSVGERVADAWSVGKAFKNVKPWKES